MRKVVYRVAASLDGYIAGPHGELDWIVSDPGTGLADFYKTVDTALLGRRTYELTRQPGAPPWPAHWRICVFSKSLPPETDRRVQVVAHDAARVVADLRAGTGKTIWLFGGASLFGSLLAAGQVDSVEVAVMPVLLGGGLSLVEAGAAPARLRLVASEASPSGVVHLAYDVR